MHFQTTGYGRVLCLHAAAKRLQISERTLRYQASRGRIQGAFKQGKLWKFSLAALESVARRRRLVVCIVLLFLFAASTVRAATKAAPGFTRTDSSGATVSLAAYKGKVVLLNFWATWCHGCKIEIPWFMEFASRYKDSGLAVIGVSMDDDGWKLVKPYLAKNKLNYPVVIGTAALAQQYGLGNMPMTLLIDRQGNIAATHAGMVDKDACEREIRSLLSAK